MPDRAIHALKPVGADAFTLLVGVGGIGTGLFLEVEGDKTLGRNESRPARKLDVRDYCKLHIIAHHVAILTGAKPEGGGFHVLPVGRTGRDSAGDALVGEMTSAGMDMSMVSRDADHPTTLSICFQYPDRSGGNLTTSNGASGAVTPEDVMVARPVLEQAGSRAMVLAAPEVSLEVRKALLEVATQTGAFRVASFASEEMKQALDENLLSMVDLLAINEDEASALAGKPFDASDAQAFMDALQQWRKTNWPDLNMLVSAGSLGAWMLTTEGMAHCPGIKADAKSTAGAGDALLGGVMAALAMGWPMLRPEGTSDTAIASALDLGVAVAAFNVGSEHTIHPDLTLEAAKAFAASHGRVFDQSLI